MQNNLSSLKYTLSAYLLQAAIMMFIELVYSINKPKSSNVHADDEMTLQH